MGGQKTGDWLVEDKAERVVKVKVEWVGKEKPSGW